MTGIQSLIVVAAASSLLISGSCTAKKDVSVPEKDVTLVAAPQSTTQQTPHPVRESLVTLTIRGAAIKPCVECGDDKEGVRTRTGIVIADGRVLTTLGGLDGAEWVEVVDARGIRSMAKGVAQYLGDANIALLDVEWSGATPPAAMIAGSSPARGSTITFLSTKGEEARACQLVECRTPTTLFAKWPTCPDASGQHWIATSEGKVVGITTGLFAGVAVNVEYPGCDPTCVIFVSRPEALLAMEAQVTVPWPEWMARQTAIRRSRSLMENLPGSSNEPEAERSKRALAEVELATRLDPRNARAWSMLARHAAYKNDTEGAVNAARRALALVPTDSTSSYIIATNMGKQGEYEVALKAIDAAILEDEPDATQYHLKAVLLSRLDRTDDAIRTINFAILLDPRNEDFRAVLESLKKMQEFETGTKRAPTKASF